MLFRSTVRRGYFVDGLGGAQFAVPGAVDRLRACKDVSELHDDTSPLVMAATDPAQPYGASIDWPTTNGRPMRSAGAMVVLHRGDAIAWYDVRSHHLVTFEHRTHVSTRSVLAEALRTLVKDGRVRTVEIRKINGEAHDDAKMSTVAIADELMREGFVRGYRGLVLRDGEAT